MAVCAKLKYWQIVAMSAIVVLTACRTRERLWTQVEIDRELSRTGVDVHSPIAADLEGESNQQNSSIRHLASITLADLQSAAELHNPRIAAARAENGIAAGQVMQASLYPNPRVELSFEEIPVNRGVEDGKVTVGVVQPIVIGGRLRAAVSEAEAGRARSLANLQAVRLETFGEIAELYTRILAGRAAHALNMELHDLNAKTLAAAQTRFEAKAAPEMDVIRPQVEAYRFELTLSRLEREQRTALQELRLLVGEPHLRAEQLVGDFQMEFSPLDASEIEAQVRNRHPQLLSADWEIEAAASRLARIRAERVPDLDVGLAGGRAGDRDEGIIEFGIGASIPLWDQHQGDILAARFALMHARQLRAAAESELLARLAVAIGQYDIARTQAEALRARIVPAAQKSFEQSNEAYRNGRASFLDLLDAQRTLAEARLALIETATDAALAEVRVGQIAGAAANRTRSDQNTSSTQEVKHE